jgi:hypothetical protein
MNRTSLKINRRKKGTGKVYKMIRKQNLAKLRNN